MSKIKKFLKKAIGPILIGVIVSYAFVITLSSLEKDKEIERLKLENLEKQLQILKKE